MQKKKHKTQEVPQAKTCAYKWEFSFSAQTLKFLEFPFWSFYSTVNSGVEYSMWLIQDAKTLAWDKEWSCSKHHSRVAKWVFLFMTKSCPP